MKIEITKAQLDAIASLTSDIEAMIGCSDCEDGMYEGAPDTDKVWSKRVKLIDRMFKKNNLKR